MEVYLARYIQILRSYDNWCKFILILRHFWIFQQFEESNFWSVPQNMALLDQYLDRYLIDLPKTRTLHHKLSNINSWADLQCKENIKLIFDLFQTIVFSSPQVRFPDWHESVSGNLTGPPHLGSPQSIYLILSFQHLLGSFKPGLGISMSKQAQLCPQSHAGQNNTIRYDEI